MDLGQNQTTTQEGQGTEDVFYNVLPKEREDGPLLNSKIEKSSGPITEQGLTPITPPALDGPMAIPAHKTAYAVKAGAGLLILLLSVGGFMVYRSYKSRDIAADKNAYPTPTVSDQQDTAKSKTTAEWQKQYFGTAGCQTETTCGDGADPDRDGLTNAEEFTVKTDPNNADSDSDGLADGDEAHIFQSNPLNSHTGNNSQFTDSDFAKGGYSYDTDTKYTTEQLQAVKDRIKEFDFHQPSVTTLGEFLLKTYDFQNSSSPAQTDNQPLPAGTDTSPEAMLERDSQRLATIKKVGSALLKYKTDYANFPGTTDFSDMTQAIKPYLLIATNTKDPINKNQYVYTYAARITPIDFTMSYYSETQKQLIIYNTADAQKDSSTESANLNDDQRTRDVENIRLALLVYSSANIAGSQTYVFPIASNYKTDLVPKYLSAVPKDPKTNLDYEYKVSDKFDSFTLKAILENPSTGTTGYLCNQEECRNY